MHRKDGSFKSNFRATIMSTSLYMSMVNNLYTKIGENYSMKHSSLAAFYYYSGYGGEVIMGYVLWFNCILG